ncbi:MAG: rhodanese-like domain-containing protein [Verrucomicrobia bacterium]|nr:MAG: rhodanese-like domain-containing protein [Verrucomicrobiota bacterium]
MLKDKIMKPNNTVLLVLAVIWSLIGAGVARAADAKEEKKPQQKAFNNVDVAGFEKLRADKQNVVLDVRTQKEFVAGHIPGAVNIDVNAPDFQEKVSKLDKTRTYLLHCAGGVRSAKACDKMSTLDFPKLYNLEGGFRAWEKAGNKPEK